MHIEIARRSKEICSLYNVECEVKILKGYPALINDNNTTNLTIDVAKEMFGKNAVSRLEPLMWAEDFAYYAREVPATFWCLGVKPENIKEMYGLHNAKFNPDEKALVYGTALMAGVALRFLRKL